ncbi:MAG: hypothetical protein ACNFW9_00855 [Candidatus Kerfeldbacteria bacterium]|jgi:hypothetical protein
MKLHNTLLMLFVIFIMLICQSCGRFVNIQVLERPENKPPSKDAFKVYPSNQWNTRLHLLSAYPIQGRGMKLYIVYKAPRDWELSSAEYSLDGLNWVNLPFGAKKFGAKRSWGHAFIKNKKDQRERTIFVRGWFRRINQSFDYNTGRVIDLTDDVYGPVLATMPVYHSRR